MGLSFSIFLPLLVNIAPLLFLLIFGIRKIREKKGFSIATITGIALAAGLITPFIAITTSITSLSFYSIKPTGQCYTFVAGYIGIGIIIEIFFIPLTALILKLNDENTDNWFKHS